MKKIFSVITAIFLSMCLFSCESSEEKAVRLEKEKQTAKLAEEYTKEKYGFSAEVVSYKSDYLNQIFGIMYTDYVVVEMRNDGKDFVVYISNDGKDAKDNYQHEEIRNAIKELAEEKKKGVKDVVLRGYDYVQGDEYYEKLKDSSCLCQEYFDGTNLKEVLDECYANFCVCYTDVDFGRESDWIQEFQYNPGKYKNVNRQLVSYRSDEAMEELPNVIVSDETKYNSVFAPYIEEVRLSYGYHMCYDIRKHGDFFYLTYGFSDPDSNTTGNYNYDNDNIVPNGGIEFTGGKDMFREIATEQGTDTFIPVGKPFSYSVTEESYVYIYYPLDKLKNDKRYVLGNNYISNKGKVGYRTDNAEIVGNYVVSGFLADDIGFKHNAEFFIRRVDEY